jgi:hypothetical protein
MIIVITSHSSVIIVQASRFFTIKNFSILGKWALTSHEGNVKSFPDCLILFLALIEAHKLQSPFPCTVTKKLPSLQIKIVSCFIFIERKPFTINVKFLGKCKSLWNEKLGRDF